MRSNKAARYLTKRTCIKDLKLPDNARIAITLLAAREICEKDVVHDVSRRFCYCKVFGSAQAGTAASADDTSMVPIALSATTEGTIGRNSTDWSFRHTFAVSLSDTLLVELYEDHPYGDTVLGKTLALPVADLKVNTNNALTRLELALTPPDEAEEDASPDGAIILEFASNPNVLVLSGEEAAAADAATRRLRVGILRLVVWQARAVRCNRRPCFILAKLGRQERRTKVMETAGETANPVWDASMEFDVFDIAEDLRILVIEVHQMRKDRTVGQAVVPVANLMGIWEPTAAQTSWFELLPPVEPAFYNRGGQYRTAMKGTRAEGFGLPRPEQPLGFVKLGTQLQLCVSVPQVYLHPAGGRSVGDQWRSDRVSLPSIKLNMRRIERKLLRIPIWTSDVSEAFAWRKNPPLTATLLALHCYMFWLMPVWQLPIVIALVLVYTGAACSGSRSFRHVYIYQDEINLRPQGPGYLQREMQERLRKFQEITHKVQKFTERGASLLEKACNVLSWADWRVSLLASAALIAAALVPAAVLYLGRHRSREFVFYVGLLLFRPRRDRKRKRAHALPATGGSAGVAAAAVTSTAIVASGGAAQTDVLGDDSALGMRGRRLSAASRDAKMAVAAAVAALAASATADEPEAVFKGYLFSKDFDRGDLRLNDLLEGRGGQWERRLCVLTVPPAIRVMPRGVSAEDVDCGGAWAGGKDCGLSGGGGGGSSASNTLQQPSIVSLWRRSSNYRARTSSAAAASYGGGLVARRDSTGSAGGAEAASFESQSASAASPLAIAVGGVATPERTPPSSPSSGGTLSPLVKAFSGSSDALASTAVVAQPPLKPFFAGRALQGSRSNHSTPERKRARDSTDLTLESEGNVNSAQVLAADPADRAAGSASGSQRLGLDAAVATIDLSVRKVVVRDTQKQVALSSSDAFPLEEEASSALSLGAASRRDSLGSNGGHGGKPKTSFFASNPRSPNLKAGKHVKIFEIRVPDRSGNDKLFYLAAQHKAERRAWVRAIEEARAVSAFSGSQHEQQQRPRLATIALAASAAAAAGAGTTPTDGEKDGAGVLVGGSGRAKSPSPPLPPPRSPVLSFGRKTSRGRTATEDTAESENAPLDAGASVGVESFESVADSPSAGGVGLKVFDGSSSSGSGSGWSSSGRLFLEAKRSAMKELVGTAKQAIRHFLESVPDDLDLEHRYICARQALSEEDVHARLPTAALHTPSDRRLEMAHFTRQASVNARSLNISELCLSLQSASNLPYPLEGLLRGIGRFGGFGPFSRPSLQALVYLSPAEACPRKYASTKKLAEANPVWREDFLFKPIKTTAALLVIELYHRKSDVAAEKLLGVACAPMACFLDKQPHDIALPLSHDKESAELAFQQAAAHALANDASGSNSASSMARNISTERTFGAFGGSRSALALKADTDDVEDSPDDVLESPGPSFSRQVSGTPSSPGSGNLTDRASDGGREGDFSRQSSSKSSVDGVARPTMPVRAGAMRDIVQAVSQTLASADAISPFGGFGAGSGATVVAPMCLQLRVQLK